MILIYLIPGEYTCEARDFGIAQNKSDLVDVITTPMVDIDPMADYVPYGGSIRIRCLSFDQDALQYEWYVNNLLIKRGRSDMIPETLQPAGSQLYVRRLLKRAIFTCKVTNAAGAQNVTADIYVQPGTETIRTRKFSFNAFQFRPRCFHDNLLQLTILTIPAISSGIRVFCGRKWQAAITGRNDVQQKQGVRNQNYLQRFMFSHSSEFTTKCTRFIWRLSLFVQIFKTTSL